MERGQASIEWLGAVALVGAVLAAVVAVAGAAGGEAVASSVVRAFHRGLCLVRGGVCDLDRRPCVVEANATRDEAHLNLLVVRVGRRELILREHRADGSVLVSYLHETGAGWDVGVGGDVWASAAGREIMAGAAARAALLTSLGGGETWLFDDARDADVAMAQLSEGHAPTRGRRTARVVGSGLELEAGARARRFGVSAALGLHARRVHGTVVDEATGARTHVVDRGAGAEALIARRDDEVRGAGAVGERLSVITAADGTPLELTVARTGELGIAADLPDVARPVAGELVGRGDRRWVVEQRLDLTEPASLAAARELLAALDGPAPVLAGASERLRKRLAEAGITEVRTYDVERDASGVVGHGSLGVKVGGGLTDATDRARLRGARILGPGGAWRATPACAVS